MFVFLIGLILTFVVTWFTYHNEERHEKKDFALSCADIKTKTFTRLNAHSLFLQDCSSFLSLSDTVTRADWASFVENSKIARYLPGYQGIGYNMIIPKEQLRQHILKIRKDGLPDYKIIPEGERETYTSIIYIEPQTGRNLKAIGYDTYMEPVRKKAMEQARDSKLPSLTSKLTLVTENKMDEQTGVIIYNPVYRKRLPLTTIEERKAAILGWVSSPYRMNDLMQGILGSRNNNQQKRIHLQIFEDSLSVSSMLYDNESSNSVKCPDSTAGAIILPMEFYGKKWVLIFMKHNIESAFMKGIVIIVFISGILLSMLLFLLTLSLMNTRLRSGQIAEKLITTLRESKQRFKNMFKFHSSIMLLIDPETGLIVDANEAAVDFYGYNKAMLCSLNINQINLQKPEQVVNEYNKALNRIKNTFIFSHRLASGEQRIVEVHSSPIEFSGKQILFSIIYDITQRDRAEKELWESSQRIQAIISASPDGIGILSLDGKLEFMSDKLFDMYRLSTDERDRLYGESVFRFIDPSYHKSLTENIRKLLAGKKDQKLTEYQAIRNDNTRFFIDINSTVLLNSEGKPANILFIERDITERKKVEEALKNESLQRKTLFEQSPDGILIIDPITAKFLEFNTAAHQQLGYSRDEFARLSIHDVEAIETVEETNIQISKVISNGKGEFETLQRNKNGEIRNVYVKAQIITINSVLIYYCIWRDNTKIKKAELEIVHKNEELKILNAQKDKFFSIIGHDLKSPFNSILGFSELLIQDVDQTQYEKVKMYSDLILKSSKLAMNLLNNLLEWSLSQTGRMNFKPEHLNMVNLINETVPLFINIANQKMIQITTELPDSVQVFGDKAMISTIFRNLISNAIKYTVPEGKIIISAKETQKVFTFSIKDSGVGIKKARIEKLFRIDENQSTLGTQKENGTGLGLILCKEFVEKHGGKIWVESEEGKGSDFKFTLTTSSN